MVGRTPSTFDTRQGIGDPSVEISLPAFLRAKPPASVVALGLAIHAVLLTPHAPTLVFPGGWNAYHIVLAGSAR